MGHYTIKFLAETTGPPADPSAVLDHIDDVTAELAAIEEVNGQVVECDVSAHLADGTVEIEVVVDAADRLDAMSVAASVVRAAIHAADGFTPGWDEVLQTTSVAIVAPDSDPVPA